MPLSILVTGGGGFLGRNVVAALSRDHALLVAELAGVPSVEQMRWIAVREAYQLGSVVAREKPDLVIHCAFVNRKPAGCAESAYLAEMISVNLPLFELCAAAGSRLLLISSSAVYARARLGEAVAENHPLGPVTVYGVAKLMQEMLAQYQASRGLQLCIARLFNLCGPGQPKGMLVPDWITQAAAIARGAPPLLRVRNRATARDFVDVRDAARAIRLLVDDFRPGEVVNVSSGVEVKLREIIEELQKLSPVSFEVLETEPELDVTDLPRQRGSFERIEQGWGWKPEIDWRTSLADVWRECQPTASQSVVVRR